MSKFAQVGDFCPNEVCPDYDKLQGERQQDIIGFGKTEAGNKGTIHRPGSVFPRPRLA